MQFDSGEVLPGLNENWTFMGASAIEWMCGLMVFLIISVFARSPSVAMPFMLAGGVGTTVTMASMRRMFPDEERGLRNALVTACGLPPPRMPAPSKLQPVWSGAPMRELKKDCLFVDLGLDEMFPSFEDDLKDVDQ